MPIYCKSCKKENPDPGSNVSFTSCKFCGGGPLVKSKGIGRVGGAGLGAAIGARFGGPFGAIVGGVLGYLVGNEADKNI